jgi:hypothetical protein
MRNLLGIFVLVAVVSGCGMLGKTDGSKTGASPAPSATAASPQGSTDSKSGLTLEKFDRLQNGMKYEEVVRILGAEGVETSNISAGSMQTVTYKWEGENYARITATFQNGELTTKMQSNLKGANDSSGAAADLTLEKYNRLQTGMSYKDAVGVIGSEGAQTSSSTIAKTSTVSYKWEGKKFERIFATFRDDKLASKSQSNLK